MKWRDDRTAFSPRPLRHEAATEPRNQAWIFMTKPASITNKHHLQQ